MVNRFGNERHSVSFRIDEEIPGPSNRDNISTISESSDTESDINDPKITTINKHKAPFRDQNEFAIPKITLTSTVSNSPVVTLSPSVNTASSASSSTGFVDFRGKPREKFRCTECRMCYVRRTYLIKHIMGRHDANNCCLKCMQLFNSKQDLEKHKTDFHSRNICDVCGGAFATRFLLKQHIESHRDKHDQVFKCPFTGCEFTHKRFPYFEYHINKHRKKSPFACGKCKKEFCSRYNFNRHVKVCIGDFGRCPKCEKDFSCDSSLYDHIQSCHLKRIYACPVCDNTYKWRASLSRHITKKHREID